MAKVGGPIPFNDDWGGTTQKDNTIYVHIINWPDNGILQIPYSGTKIKAATYLATNKKVDFAQDNGLITINRPDNTQDEIVTVIKLKIH